MGAWGTSLYANDAASDLRGDYLHLLRSGNTNDAATDQLIENNKNMLNDPEEAPLFWYALADTQWNYGRLLPEVKENALRCLKNRTEELERWQDSGEKIVSKWIATLDALEEKLSRSQPPEKKVSKYRLYQCKWALGDVFAYQFSGEYSKQTGYFGKYIVFRKISETFFYPGHIIPVVQIYSWVGDHVPLNLEEVYNTPILPAIAGCHRDYYALLTTSARSIPKENITWLENRPGPDLVPYPDDEYYWFNFVLNVGWEGSCWNRKLEKTVIDNGPGDGLRGLYDSGPGDG